MMKQSEDKKIEKLQTMIFTGILVAVFVLLIRLVWPDGCFYGSTTDWYNQHMTLLCYSLSGSDRLVCSGNAPQGRCQGTQTPVVSGCYQCYPVAWNGNDAASSDIHDDSGA